jgi:hypothetical protein
MSGIKTFFYLDEYKMYSISSQILEGLTESFVQIRASAKQGEERQSGPFGSGRVIAEILQQESQQHERKYLHDYSYTLFEQQLKQERHVPIITADNVEEFASTLDRIDFIEVRAKPVFNDMNILRETIEQFNDLGEALTYLTHSEEIIPTLKAFQEAEQTTADRNQRARTKQQRMQAVNIAKMAEDDGLRMQPEFLKNLAYILKFGFQDQFEVQMPIGGFKFSANLRREYLRESENILIRKFSRMPDGEFVLFGTVAQAPKLDEGHVDEERDQAPKDPTVLKEALMGMVQSIADIEANFTGRLSNEVVIDPIALYREF